MKKQEFLDKAVIAMLSTPQMHKVEDYWISAGKVWDARPKEEREKGSGRVTNEMNDQYWVDFWNAYDKKVGTASAKEKFMAISTEDMPSVIEAAKVYAKSTPEVKYRKNPVTWLNQKCWLDSPIEDKKKQSQIGFL